MASYRIMLRLYSVLFLSGYPVFAQYLITTVVGGGTPDGLPAISAGVGEIGGVAADGFGNVYIASRTQNRVLKVDSLGKLTVVAGNGGGGFSGDGGPAAAATLYNPSAVAVDELGNLYISDVTNCRVRKVTNGVITTVAGNGNCLPTGRFTGPATSVAISPLGIALDRNGVLYIGDTTSNIVWKLAGGVISPFAGTGSTGFDGDGRPAVNSALSAPGAVAVDATGAVYIDDFGNHRIRVVVNGIMNTFVSAYPIIDMATDAGGNVYFCDLNRVYRVFNGVVVTVAGGGSGLLSGMGGPALDAAFSPNGIRLDGAGRLYIADGFNRRVFKVDNGVIEIFAGDGSDSFATEQSPATAAVLSRPNGVAVDSKGNIYCADVGNNRIRKISNGISSTVVTSPGNSIGPMAVDGSDRIYFVDGSYVRSIDSNGTVSIVAGNGGGQFTGDGGPATSAGMQPREIAVNRAGDLFIVDGSRIRKVSHGLVTTVVGNGANDSTGDGGPATEAALYFPYQVAVDELGNLYIAEPQRIRKVTGGIITTLAKTSPFTNETVFVDLAGKVYIGRPGEIDVLNGAILAGGAQPGFRGDGGPAVGAALNNPTAMAFGASGNIYVADTENNRIRVLVPTSAANPFGSFDTPVDHISGVAGAIPVTGWALDSVEVSSVGIWREPVGPEPTQSNGLVYVGNTTFVPGARPDVQTAYSGLPFNSRAGWGYLLLTNFLPGNGNGTYKLHAIATNKLGLIKDLGVKTFTADNAHANKPFGTIDTPDQGGGISGQIYNFAWALTPQPQCIPTDGSTMTVIVDGVNLGHPVYNQPRSDIMSVFPGYCNTNGAVGFFLLDSTKLTNGLHTISWVVYDNLGRGDGIGSRYFTVANLGATTMKEGRGSLESGWGPEVSLRRGFGSGSGLEQLAADQNGSYLIDVEELDRIELNLGATEGANLPVGSTLRGGTFYWQLGPGFLGEHLLNFVRSDRTTMRVRVSIRPKSFANRTLN
jgi:sugar lactone lactonase YvrE